MTDKPQGSKATKIFFRVVLLCLLTFLVVIYLVPSRITVFSEDAYINAKRIDVYAPINGIVENIRYPADNILSKGDWLEIKGVETSSWNLNQMSVEQAMDEGRVKELRNQREMFFEQLADLKEQSERSLEFTVSNLTQLLNQRVTELNSLENIVATTKNVYYQQSQLYRNGHTTLNKLNDAKTAYQNAVNDLEVMKREILRIENILDAAENGIYIDNGYFDFPATDQIVVQIKQRINEVNKELAAWEKAVAVRERMIEKEAEFIETQRHRTISLPRDVVVWASFADESYYVEANQQLLIGFSCETLFITAYVNNSKLDEYAPGSKVYGKLLDIYPEVLISGTVLSVRSTQVQDLDSSFIVQNRMPEELSEVVIELDDKEKFNDPSRFCWVGAKVKLQIGNNSEKTWLDELLLRLN